MNAAAVASTSMTVNARTLIGFFTTMSRTTRPTAARPAAATAFPETDVL
jgi:hypothetical protein